MMAMAKQERSAKTAAKRAAAGEVELRHRVRPGTPGEELRNLPRPRLRCLALRLLVPAVRHLRWLAPRDRPAAGHPSRP